MTDASLIDHETGENVITYLKTARDLKTLPILSYGNSGSRYVKVRSLNARYHVESTAPGGAIDAKAQRTGYVDVVCEEITT